MSVFARTKAIVGRFMRDETGVVTVEFLIVFPVFFGFFLMTYESGMISLRQVMLEHGVDITVREVRIGAMPTPTAELIRARICGASLILPDCEDQLRLELIQRNPRTPSDWAVGLGDFPCINRGLPVQPVMSFTNGDNNDLMILRVCIRIDPILPASVLGKAIKVQNENGSAGGSYALVTRAAFVVEPFKSTTGGT